MDPSCTIGFYAKGQHEFESLRSEVQQVWFFHMVLWLKKKKSSISVFVLQWFKNKWL